MSSSRRRTSVGESLMKYAAGADAAPGGSAPAATQRLVGVPLAVTTHRLWGARAMLSRGLRWGYAGGLIAAKVRG